MSVLVVLPIVIAVLVVLVVPVVLKVLVLLVPVQVGG